MENLKINGTTSVQQTSSTSKKEETKATTPEMKKDGNKKLKLALAGLAAVGVATTAGVLIYKGHGKKAVKVLEGVKTLTPPAPEGLKPTGEVTHVVQEATQEFFNRPFEEALSNKSAEDSAKIFEKLSFVKKELANKIENHLNGGQLYCIEEIVIQHDHLVVGKELSRDADIEQISNRLKKFFKEILGKEHYIDHTSYFADNLIGFGISNKELSKINDVDFSQLAANILDKKISAQDAVENIFKNLTSVPGCDTIGSAVDIITTGL